MNRIYTIILTAAVLTGCAKVATEGTNDDAKLFLDAWASLNLPGNTPIWNGQPDPYGLYLIDETPGTGEVVTEDGYAILTYTVTDLEGNITSYTDKETAKQLHAYDTTTYYGPRVWLMQDETIQAGLQNAITGMKVGGEKKVLIPSWLLSYKTYGSAKKYFDTKSEYSDAIYSLKIEDYTTDVNEWQIARMKEYMDANYNGGWESFNQDVRKDTTGFYFRSLSENDVTGIDFKADTTIYINYTGKLLNGLVFDTTLEKVAKDNGLHVAGKSYEPVQINWGEEHSDITMGSSSSSVVSGFSLTLWNMKDLGEGQMDKAVGIFYSPLGYGYSGSGASIPGYAPLIFEIEIAAKPE